MMRRVALATALTLTAQGALADLASFEKAFTGICLNTMPGLEAAPEQFRAEGWDGYAGADPGEWEFYKNGTEVFLATNASGAQPGCTVRDAAPSQLEALWLMELWLDKHYAGNWIKGKDDYGPVWRLLLPEGMVVFHLNEDQNKEGGASVSFELRR